MDLLGEPQRERVGRSRRPAVERRVDPGVLDAAGEHFGLGSGGVAEPAVVARGGVRLRLALRQLAGARGAAAAERAGLPLRAVRQPARRSGADARGDAAAEARGVGGRGEGTFARGGDRCRRRRCQQQQQCEPRRGHLLGVRPSSSKVRLKMCHGAARGLRALAPVWNRHRYRPGRERDSEAVLGLVSCRSSANAWSSWLFSRREAAIDSKFCLRTYLYLDN